MIRLQIYENENISQDVMLKHVMAKARPMAVFQFELSQLPDK